MQEVERFFSRVKRAIGVNTLVFSRVVSAFFLKKIWMWKEDSGRRMAYMREN